MRLYIFFSRILEKQHKTEIRLSFPKSDTSLPLKSDFYYYKL